VSNCYFCKGKTEIKNIDVDFRWGNKLFVVKNVPVEVCTQCGERYYSAEVSKKLDELVKKEAKSTIKPQMTIEVPIFNWQ
jgi:YgiT-type zinc finger domain-containing protein